MTAFLIKQAFCSRVLFQNVLREPHEKGLFIMWIGNKINKPSHVLACVCAFLFLLCDSPPNVLTPQPRPSVLFKPLEYWLDKVPTSVCWQLSCNLRDNTLFRLEMWENLWSQFPWSVFPHQHEISRGVYPTFSPDVILDDWDFCEVDYINKQDFLGNVGLCACVSTA